MNNGCISTVFLAVCFTNQAVSLNEYHFIRMNVVNERVQLPPGRGAYVIHRPPLGQVLQRIDLQLNRSMEYIYTEIAKFKAFSFKFYHFLFALLHLSYLLL